MRTGHTGTAQQVCSALYFNKAANTVLMQEDFVQEVHIITNKTVPQHKQAALVPFYVMSAFSNSRELSDQSAGIYSIKAYGQVRVKRLTGKTCTQKSRLCPTQSPTKSQNSRTKHNKTY